MDPRFNGIVWTGSGLLDVRSPDPAAIHPKDIGRGLARRYRFGGHTRDDLAPYSVAWHSLFCEMVADQMGLPLRVRLQALLHDAPEFVLGDMVTPVKRLLRDYGPLETSLWNATAARFGIPAEFDLAVHEIDALALEVERFHLCDPWPGVPDPVVPDEWAAVAARWIGFCQDRAAQAGPLAAALFCSRLAALLEAVAQAQEVVE